MVSDTVVQTLPALVGAITGLVGAMLGGFIALTAWRTHQNTKEAVDLIRALHSRGDEGETL